MARIPVEASSARTIRVGGRELLFFGGCNYLGLAHHPRVLDAARAGLERFGLSTAASRETTGNTVPHDALERDLADFLGAEEAVLLPDGATANLAAAEALARDARIALCDERAHATLLDAAHAAGFELAAFSAPDALLAAIHRERGTRGYAVVTDGVFPAEGRAAELAALRAAAGGAWLLVDDCHGFGVLGKSGCGALEHAALGFERIAYVATLSKAFGCAGGFVAGGRELCARVRDAHAYVGTTPIAPALAEAGRAALVVAREEPERRARLFEHVEVVRAALTELGIERRPLAFPVLTFRLEPPERMGALQRRLGELGIFLPVVEYLGDPPGGQVRLALHAEHTRADVEGLCGALRATGGLR